MTEPLVLPDIVRVVVFSDTHLGFDYPIRPRVERRRRGPDFFASFQRVLDYAVETRADLLLHSGDFFFRSKVSPVIVDRAYLALLDVASLGIPVCVVPGNHERSVLPPSLFLSHENVHVVQEPQTLVFDLPGCRLALAAFPFASGIQSSFSSKVEATGVRQIEADVRMLAFHQSVAGASVGPSGYTFVDAEEVVRLRDIPRDFEAVICGHIHRHQILTQPDGRAAGAVIFPGSTERTSFAEEREEKGFLELVFARCGNEGRWSLRENRFRVLDTRPMHTLDIDGGWSSALLAAYVVSGCAELDRDAIVRLRWSSPPSPDQTQWLTGERVRALVPATMNVQLSRFFPARALSRPGVRVVEPLA
ncbi:MAG: DNA repair exonuclease [Gammaproteobacteria bacterium]|nr:DNA repair exonuclease [Gammaproteobacteria bacterium]